MSFIDQLYKDFVITDITELEEDSENNLEEIYNRLTMDLPEECKFILENYERVVLGNLNENGDGYKFAISLSGAGVFLNELIYLQEEFSVDDIGNVIPIGDDVGDSMLLYGIGNEGLALYLAEGGSLDKDDYIKLSDTISDFFCKGIGIEKLI